MRADVKRRWLEALRSGEYQQGHGWLRDGDRFCCLGVLCDLYIDEHPAARWKSGVFDTGRGSTHASELPGHVAEWAGLLSFDPKAGAHSLAAWNDGDSDGDGQWARRPKTFAEVADMIEEHIPADGGDGP